MDLDIAALNHVRHEQALTRMQRAMVACSGAAVIQTTGLLMSLSLLSGWWLCLGLTVFGMSMAVSLTVFVACLTERMLAGRPTAAITSASATTPDGLMQLTVDLTTNTTVQPIYSGTYEAGDSDSVAHHRAQAEDAIEQARATWLSRIHTARYHPTLLDLNPSPQPTIEYQWEDISLIAGDSYHPDNESPTEDRANQTPESLVEQDKPQPRAVIPGNTDDNEDQQWIPTMPPSAAYIPPYRSSSND